MRGSASILHGVASLTEQLLQRVSGGALDASNPDQSRDDFSFETSSD
jgi:hypothetical protein